MAEQEDTTKVEDEINQALSVEEPEELMSLESLDSALAEEDPDFAEALSEIGSEEIAAGEFYDDSLLLEYTLAEEEKKWQEAVGFRKHLLKVLPFLPKISYLFNVKRTQLRLGWVKFKHASRHRVRNAIPLSIEWLKSQVLNFRQFVGEALTSFKSFAWPKKIGVLSLIVATLGAVFLFYRMGTKGLMPQGEELFIRSMSEWASEKYQFDPNHGMESFYDSTRIAQNIFLMQKMVVNLRRSADSSENPMGAFEFYVEGGASDVVVEIKDREAEVEDLFLRTLEEVTFEQASSGEGKQAICDRLRNEVNKILTKGYVRRIFIKTAIIKP